MNINPILPRLVASSLVALITGPLLRFLKQPCVVAYIIAGVLLSPYEFTLITDEITLSHLGASTLIDLDFLKEHLGMISLLVGAVFVTNTFINALVLRFLGTSWKESLYAGSLLSQIGEFSYVLGALALQSKIITKFGYQLTIAIISLSLLLSLLVICLIKGLVKVPVSY